MRLKSLNLSNNKFDGNSGLLLARGIVENASLLALDLSWNNFRKRGGAALCKGLEVGTYSYYTEVAHAGAFYLVYLPLQENTTLQTLNLSWNGLGLEGATALSNIFKKNSAIIDLDIR